MNDWMRDPRVAQAEVDAFEADRAGGADAPALWLKAAAGFAGVAREVPETHPATRGALAGAALASFARAGRSDLAADFARRMLDAVGDGPLADDVRAELRRLAGSTAAT